MAALQENKQQRVLDIRTHHLRLCCSSEVGDVRSRESCPIELLAESVFLCCRQLCGRQPPNSQPCGQLQQNKGPFQHETSSDWQLLAAKKKQPNEMPRVQQQITAHGKSWFPRKRSTNTTRDEVQQQLFMTSNLRRQEKHFQDQRPASKCCSTSIISFHWSVTECKEQRTLFT